MAAHNLTPALLGATSWDAISPTGRADAGAGQGHPTSTSPLVLRRAFYWTMRFTHWDSVRYVASVVAANERLVPGASDAASPQSLNLYTNFNVSLLLHINGF